MATIVTRAGKGSSLSFAEVDANFTNLNNDKLENFTGPAQVDSATYTVLSSDTSVIFHTTPCTVTLPDPTTHNGRVLFFKNRSAIAIVSDASNVKPLATDIAGTDILSASAGKFAMLQSDGTSWIIMMAN